jgi:uncharacterized protein (DUF1501 family)
LARRLVEAGTRFVEVIWPKVANSDNHSWDHHAGLSTRMKTQSGPMLDAGLSSLIADLDERGLLKDTLVVWCTEFGRMPTFQAGASGRDHNPAGFTAWLAGAGVKAPYSFGATDDFGYKAVQNVATVYDFHATILQILGLDHERLSFYHNGIERRLTDVHGEVLEGVLA